MASIFKRKGAKRYTIRYIDGNGQRREKVGTSDKQTTERIAAKLEADAQLRLAGVIDPVAERMAKSERQPLGDHLHVFQTALESKGSTEGHISETIAYIRSVCDACGYKIPRDLDATAVSSHVAELRRDGKSARSINKRLTAIKTFTRWMCRQGRLRIDPMVQISKLNTQVDRRLQRRALTDDEIDQLIETTSQQPTWSWREGRTHDSERRHIRGPWRAVLYQLTLGTGLRRGELASLTLGSFDLSDLDAATVTVKAAYSKRRREDVLPIRRDLGELLLNALQDCDLQTPIFRLPDNTADMLRADLKAAGIPERDDSGHVVDFHALRHTYITRLARSGGAPAVAKSLARHSTISLTIDHYTHIGQR